MTVSGDFSWPPMGNFKWPLTFTSEYRFGTIRPTFLFNPSRERLMVTKVIAGALSGLVFGVIGEGLVFAIGLAILKFRGVPFVMTGSNTTELLVGAVVGTALWGAIGVGVGAVVPNQVAAVISLLAWGFVVENLVFGFLPKIGRFLPVHVADSMMGHIEPQLLPGNLGSVVLVGWCVLIAGFGVALLRRRDVN